MAVNWNLSSMGWEEGVSTWKTSNIALWSESTIGAWSTSTVLGWYMSNYGLVKTQLMLGYERKINLASKYEWYMTAPTKVLIEGENKIDMKEYNKVAPVEQRYALQHRLTMSQDEINAFERNLKAFKDAKTVAGASSTTCASHTLTVNAGDSSETIALGNKTITAAVGAVTIGATAGEATLQGGPSSVVLNAAGATVSGALINLG